MKGNKSKSGKKSHISVSWKVSDRVGDLHTDKKQLRAQFETIPHR